MKRLTVGLGALVFGLLVSGCVSGGQVRADAEVIQTKIERARRSGAMQCAPRELAEAQADLEFSRGELSEGHSGRAERHVRLAEAAANKALDLSKGCAPKALIIRNKPKTLTVPIPKKTATKPPPPPKKTPVVIKIEETDQDGDGILDKDDSCPSKAEDLDGFSDSDGCPDADNDHDGVLDAADHCPNTPGTVEGHGCPVQTAKDQDGDGVVDSADKCPGQPEDVDGFQDGDGCPESDNDGDGLVDAVDRCPNEKGPLQNLGCPVIDHDGDGIPDSVDKCPQEPEDHDGYQDEDGCPDLDNDSDGVADALDKCPAKAGPASNHGCPVSDSDHDGIADDVDKCPDVPGVSAEHGCPKKYRLIVVQKNQIQLKQQIRFRSGSARIVSRLSWAILRELTDVLRTHPNLRIRIEGNTDSIGNDLYNLKLSQRRAQSVKAALMRLGIDPSRMETIGYGETRPIATNATRAGRAKNRRTEFHIISEGNGSSNDGSTPSP